MRLKDNSQRNVLIILLLFGLVVIKANSQTSDIQPIKLYDGVAPGSENWNWSENEKKTKYQTWVYNVTEPTLTVFPADKSIATGQAVIVCPGGAFHFLSMTHEGYDIAKWLNEKGITAFILKYRLNHCLTDNPVDEINIKMKDNEKYMESKHALIPLAIADGKKAVEYLRNHAPEWDINPNEIGIMGFSAGGTVATGVAYLYEKNSRPDFVVAVYPYFGGFGNPPVPIDAPPLFITVASNDNYGHHKGILSLYSQWIDANKSAELHIYRTGGHGFATRRGFSPANTWIDRFYEWLNNL